MDGQRLIDWDALGFCFVLVAGGKDTTGALISHTVMLFDAVPDQRAKLVGDLDLLPNALVKFLRMEGSVQGLARTTVAPVTIKGLNCPRA